jgi:hypothetical protein
MEDAETRKKQERNKSLDEGSGASAGHLQSELILDGGT